VKEGGLACQISGSGTSGILLRVVLILMLELLGVGVYSIRTNTHTRKESVQINTR
jgi:hypothetical protein